MAKEFNEKDASEFYDWIDHFSTEWSEIRAIDPNTKQADSVFVNSKKAFLKKCREWNGTRHVYAGINPRKNPSGKAEDVARVTAIPFDVDPPKAQRNISATENEKKVAFDRLQEILRYVKNRGFGEPYQDDSGNGYRLSLKVNLPITTHEETTGKLRAFFKEFEDEFPYLDNISDLPRIVKVPGTWALKGEDTPERPHRISKLIQLGDLEPNKNLENYILGLPADSATETSKPPLPMGNEKLSEEKILKLRPCFQRMIRKGGRFTPKGDRPSETRIRQQFVKEMMAAGFSKNEVLEACVKFDDYEKHKTEDEVRRVYREAMREGLTHWTCKSIHKHKACLGSECRFYLKKIEGATGTEIGQYVLKKRGNKAFLSDENDKPVDSCNLDSVDGPHFKKKLVETYHLAEEEVNRATASFSLALQLVKKKQDPEKESEEEVFDEETVDRAWQLVKDPLFFWKLGRVFDCGFWVPKINKPRFVLGEERNKRLAGPLLVGASKLNMASITKLLGEPGTAKDTIIRMWLVLLQSVKAIERSYFTAAALRYSQSMKDADLLYIPDSPELKGEMGRQLRFMRADDGGLLSEYATKDKETGEMTTKLVELPVKGVVTTSNAITGDPALESGMWTLSTNGSKTLTDDVKREKLKLRAGNRPLFPLDELKVWKCAFHILLTEDVPDSLPTVPFAESLFEMLESDRSTSRRDPDKLCDLISLVAWFRRFQKPPEKRGEADFVDLYIAFQIGLDAISQTMGDLDEKETLVFDAVKKASVNEEGTGVTIRFVTEETKIPYETTRRYLDRLVDKGFLNKDKVSNKNVYSVLEENVDKKLILSSMRRYSDPKQLTEHILKAVRNSSSHHGVRTQSFFDPLNGDKVFVEVEQNDGKVEFHVETTPLEEIEEQKNSLYYPLGELRSSERGKETLSVQEKKSKNLPIKKLVSKKPIFQNPIDEAFSNICCVCSEPIPLLKNLSNINGKPAHKRCIAKMEDGRKKTCKNLTDLDSRPFCSWLEYFLSNTKKCNLDCDGYGEITENE